MASAAAAAPQSRAQPPSAEEEALKMNTDCVYFLASPLTCKKGSECEYRHSDFARINPRDCWFWLNSNCLNPKCGFRHLPLDGVMGTPTFNGSAQPVLRKTTMMPPVQDVNANNTQGLPCKFFLSGFCKKGDWCPFLHTPNSVKHKASLVPRTSSATEPSNLNQVLIPILGKRVTPKNKGEIKPIKQEAEEVKPDVHLKEPSRKRLMSNLSCINEHLDYNCLPVSNGYKVNQFISVQQPHLPGMINNKDVGDVSREPSPGFDVLVDDKDSELYLSKNRYGMPREYEVRNEYDIVDHLTDYNMIAEVDSDRYQDRHGYDSQGYRKGQYGASLERMSAGSNLRSRSYAITELDLRHRLARNKKPRGLRSVISRDQSCDMRIDDHSCENLMKHEQHVPQHDGFLGSRLQGRIRFLQRSSSPIDNEMIRRADNGRLSSVRARLPSNNGSEEDAWKYHRGPHSKRNMTADNNADFAGPKSLAELKNRKNPEPTRHHVMVQQHLGKRKYSLCDAPQQNGGVFSFVEPKPQEEIRKQKRRSPKNESVFPVVENDDVLFSSVELTGAKENGESECVARKLETENGSVVVEEQKAYERKDEFKLDFDLHDGDNGGEYLDGNGHEEEFEKKTCVV